MKIISHRCNLNGPDNARENDIEAMRECIEMGFDVEIDVWADTRTGKLHLGHDRPEQCIDWDELAAQKENLWLHCKNLDALHTLANYSTEFNFFWHQSDDYTLTSKNIIWVYPGKAHTSRSVIVMPEWGMEVDKLGKLAEENCYGVCTDYPVRLSEDRYGADCQ